MKEQAALSPANILQSFCIVCERRFVQSCLPFFQGRRFATFLKIIKIFQDIRIFIISSSHIIILDFIVSFRAHSATLYFVFRFVSQLLDFSVVLTLVLSTSALSQWSAGHV